MFSDSPGPNVPKRHSWARCVVSQEILGFLVRLSLANVHFQALDARRPEVSVFFPDESASIGPYMLPDNCSGSPTANVWTFANLHVSSTGYHDVASWHAVDEVQYELAPPSTPPTRPPNPPTTPS